MSVVVPAAVAVLSCSTSDSAVADAKKWHIFFASLRPRGGCVPVEASESDTKYLDTVGGSTSVGCVRSAAAAAAYVHAEL